MNAAFTLRYFLRMAHLGVSSPPFDRFSNQVSLTYEVAHRCPMI